MVYYDFPNDFLELFGKSLKLLLFDKEEFIMKISNISNVEKFFKVIDSCKGKIELLTDEGDRLNLKSKLSQYVSLANIFSDGNIKELELLAYEPEDIDKLVNFMMNQ